VEHIHYYYVLWHSLYIKHIGLCNQVHHLSIWTYELVRSLLFHKSIHMVYQKWSKLDPLQMGLDPKQNANDPTIHVRWGLNMYSTSGARVGPQLDLDCSKDTRNICKMKDRKRRPEGRGRGWMGASNFFRNFSPRLKTQPQNSTHIKAVRYTC
jgi:hypothetical protein